MPQNEARNLLRQYTAQIIVSVIGAVISGVIVAIIIEDARFSPMRNPTPTILAQVATDTPTGIPIFNSLQQLQTAETNVTQLAQTRVASDLTATDEFQSNANLTKTAQHLATTEISAYSTLIVLSITPTLMPVWTITPMVATLSSETHDYYSGFNLLSLDWWGVARNTLAADRFLNIVIYFGLVSWTFFSSLAISRANPYDSWRSWRYYFLINGLPIITALLLYEALPIIILLVLSGHGYKRGQPEP